MLPEFAWIAAVEEGDMVSHVGLRPETLLTKWAFVVSLVEVNDFHVTIAGLLEGKCLPAKFAFRKCLAVDGENVILKDFVRGKDFLTNFTAQGTFKGFGRTLTLILF